jgi:threonine dehydrogenase-like Zn-dependent dehydrogenase
MRAAVITGAGKVEMADIPIPNPGPGQIRVRLEGCGVCASNLVPWSGPEWMRFPTAPGALGHEAWGVVDGVGEGVTDCRPGERVAMLSQHGYAEYDLASQHEAISLPEQLDGRLFPGEALGCAMNIFRRSKIERDQDVAIIGIGFLGGALTRLASCAGARVIALSRRPASLAFARQMGAAEIIAIESHPDAVNHVRSLTEGRFCPRVIEATGKQEPLDLAAECTAEGGRLMIAGYHQDGLRNVNLQLWNWRGIDVINAHERDVQRAVDGVRKAVDAVLLGILEPERLFTHTYPLDRLDVALNATRDHPDGFVKAVVVP